MKWAWYNFYNVYNEDQCKHIHEKLIENTSNYYKDRPAPSKKVNTYLTETEKVFPELKTFFRNVAQANQEIFGFDLFNNPETVNLNVYENDNNEYPYHKDALSLGSACDIKLTAILNISTEPYTGGEFQVFDCDDIVISEISKPGNMLVFPSFLIHRVKPVLSGKRVTVSAWFAGPNWR